MRVLGLIVVSGLIAFPVVGWGAEHGAAKSSASGTSAPPKQTLDPRGVDIAALTAPLVRNGRLVEYAFVGLRILAPSPGEANALKADLPRAQDAIVRALNANPLDQSLDDDALRQAILDLVGAALGRALEPRQVESVVVKDLVRTPV